MRSQPNILLIMADQLTASALSAYGNAVCKTPNLDQLFARSTFFEQAYCNFPVCAPSRASMLTGRMASKVGVYDNACEFPAQSPTIPYCLSALGYSTTLSGKMHFVGPDQLHGYRERLTTDIYPSDFGWTPDWEQAIPVAATGLNLRSVVESGVCTRSLQLDYDDEVVFKAVQKLREVGRRPEAEPFFLTVSLTHPHNPYVISSEYWDRYEHEDIDLPVTPALPPEELDPHSLRLRQIYKFDQYDISEADVRRSRHAYYSMVSYVDDQVGVLLETLREMNLDEDTVVVFTSDHGDMLGERGLWYKWMFFEGATRIPLAIAMPGQTPVRVAELVSLVDLMPTLVGIACQGRDLVHAVAPQDGMDILAELPPERPIFAEMTADGALSPCLMVRKHRWKYIFCEDDPPQLYDLLDDPQERINLCGQERVKDIEQELSDLVHAQWDVNELKEAMASSARQRLFIQNTRQAGEFAGWDHEPRRDPSRQFIRSGSTASATVVKGLARYPFVSPKPPDRPDRA